MTTDAADYSKAAMMRFLKTAVDQHLLNANTAAGWNAACAVVFDAVAETDDVRKIDVPTAIKRYHNKHPGELKGTVLAEYQRRVKRVLNDFQQYTNDPASYKGRGKSPTEGGKQRLKSKPAPVKHEATGLDTRLATFAAAVLPKTGMTVDFNMRPDFMAQIVVPRDMKADEARRLARFVMALAVDNEVQVGEV